MRYAVSNWIYADEPLSQTFQRLARCGYEGIELVGEPEQLAPGKVLRLCREHGLRVTSVLGWSIFGIPGRDLASLDRDEWARAVGYGPACVDLAAEVAAPILVVAARRPHAAQPAAARRLCQGRDRLPPLARGPARGGGGLMVPAPMEDRPDG